MENSGSVTAIDRDGRKLNKLSREMQRLGIDIVSPRAVDLLDRGWAASLPTRFNRILLDAPCSGLGVIRRNPDTKWSRTPEDIDRCARHQHALLVKVAGLLKPEGCLVYAVCSTEPEETQGVIKSFLKDRPDFGIDDALTEMPPSLQPLLDRRGRLLALPHRHGTDGFFAVRLKCR
jgi:16S rRNA (cytosine967-C5)-methyltransferase